MGAMISRKTLIANGYHQDIFARVENDKSSAVKCGATHLRVPTYSSSNNNNNNFRCDADGKRQQDKKLQDDDDDDEFTTHELFKEKLFTKIGPGFRACFRTARNANDSHHHQQQQQSGGGDGGVGGGTNNNNGQEEVYISIALANGDFICRGLPVSCRRNGCIIIIVDGKGNLKTGQPHSTIVTAAAGSTKSKAAWKDFVVADDDNMNNKIKKNI